MAEMTPGRKLDALIAEKVMGCKLLTEVHPYYPGVKLSDCGCKNHIHGDRNRQGSGLRKYSTDISAAWEVVERVNSLGFHFAIHRYSGNASYTAQFDKHDLDVVSANKNGTCPNPAHAICLAALKAVDIQT